MPIRLPAEESSNPDAAAAEAKSGEEEEDGRLGVGGKETIPAAIFLLLVRFCTA